MSLRLYFCSIATLKCKLCLMFVKSGHLHLTYAFPIIVVVKAVDSESKGLGRV